MRKEDANGTRRGGKRDPIRFGVVALYQEIRDKANRRVRGTPIMAKVQSKGPET